MCSDFTHFPKPLLHSNSLPARSSQLREFSQFINDSRNGASQLVLTLEASAADQASLHARYSLFM